MRRGRRREERGDLRGYIDEESRGEERRKEEI